MIEVEKKTSLGKRIAIWAIAGLMVISVVVVFANIIIASKNAEVDKQAVADAQAEMDSLLEERNEKLREQAKGLSAQYAAEFASYRNLVGGFGEIGELATEDLKVGDGETISTSVKYSAYYIGFLNDGKIFDSSFNDFSAELSDDLSSVLTLPLSGTGGSNGTIEGWKNGVEGMKIGGVRKISIPSSMGYGEYAQNDVPANSDLTFIVMMIPRIETPPFDERLPELCVTASSDYIEQYGGDTVRQVCTEEYGNYE